MAQWCPTQEIWTINVVVLTQPRSRVMLLFQKVLNSVNRAT